MLNIGRFKRTWTKTEEMQARPYLTQIGFKVVLQKSIPTQIRQLILYISNGKGQVGGFVQTHVDQDRGDAGTTDPLESSRRMHTSNTAFSKTWDCIPTFSCFGINKL